jgi:hypothetical protein
MKISHFLLLLLLLSLTLGANSGFVGCGLGGGGSAGIACISSSSDNPCDYIVTIEVNVLLAANDTPVQGATVTIGSNPPDMINTRTTDANGIATWSDTSFLTGFSAECSGEDVGTVEPYGSETSFDYDVLVTAPGLAPAGTVLTINRKSRDIVLVFRMEP